MRKKGRLRKLPISSFILLFALSAVFSVEGSVLCLGEDGHFGIEFVDRCSNQKAGKHAAFSMMTDAPQGGCGPCTDIPSVSSAKAIRASVYAKPFRDAVAVVYQTGAVFLTNRESHICLPSLPLQSKDHLEDIRTVILLI